MNIIAELTRIADECDERGLFEIANELDDIVTSKLQTKKVTMIKPTPKRVWEKGVNSIPGPGQLKKKKKKQRKADIQDDLIDEEPEVIAESRIGKLLKIGDDLFVEDHKTGRRIPIDPELALIHFGEGVAEKVGLGPNPLAGTRDVEPPNYESPERDDTFNPSWNPPYHMTHRNRFPQKDAPEVVPSDDPNDPDYVDPEELAAASEMLEKLQSGGMYEGKERCPDCEMIMRGEGEDKHCPHCVMGKTPRISMNLGNLPGGYIKRTSSNRPIPSEVRRTEILDEMR